MELSHLRAFIAVANAGGFAAAADALNVAPSTMTRAIASLEASLGVRLFQRTTRSVSLTEAGAAFLSGVLPALDELDSAADLVHGGHIEPSGTLKVSASVSFGQMVIAPHLADFCARYPNLSVDLLLSDVRIDLIAERIDLAIRHGSLDDSSLIAQRLTDVRYRLVASPEYLQSSSKITHPDDLENHACLTFPYSAFRSHWRFKNRGTIYDFKLNPTARISNAATLTTCVKTGMGLALLADWMVDRDIAEGTLQHVLPNWITSGTDADADPALWIMTPSRQFVPAKTHAFATFLKEIVAR